MMARNRKPMVRKASTKLNKASGGMRGVACSGPGRNLFVQ
jgi:hypothetical protein